MASIDTFRQSLKGDIVEPGSTEYPAAIKRWAANAERNERYVVFPKDAADTSLTIKFAASNNIPLAIKCGGHNPSGASSISDGLCIDLSRYFDTARVDPDQRLVYVGGGAVWKTVDLATIAHGLATTAGTVNDTGVAGLTLGGGYGWLTGEHGLVIDNLIQATVVLADGSIVTASPTSHPDLFWALRGGGSNFGVVTEFVFKLHPQRKTVFAGPLIFTPAHITKLAEAVDRWSKTMGNNEAAVMVFTNRTPDKRPTPILILFYNGSGEEARANFKHFYDLGPVAALADEMPYEKLNEVLSQNNQGRKCYYMSGTSLRSRTAPHAQEMYDRVVKLSATHPKSPELSPYEIMVGYEFMSLKKVASVPQEATAFRARGDQPNIIQIISWDDQDGDDTSIDNARAISQELIKLVDSAAEPQPTGARNDGYLNYHSDLALLKGQAAKQFGMNYPRLQQIKKIYDPKSVFNRWYAIQPAA